MDRPRIRLQTDRTASLGRRQRFSPGNLLRHGPCYRRGPPQAAGPGNHGQDLRPDAQDAVYPAASGQNGHVAGPFRRSDVTVEYSQGNSGR